jgi:hypothetical protein
VEDQEQSLLPCQHDIALLWFLKKQRRRPSLKDR